jgi:hypothetical protein
MPKVTVEKDCHLLGWKNDIRLSRKRSDMLSEAEPAPVERRAN